MKYFVDPDYRFEVNLSMGKYNNMDDEEFIRLLWKRFYGKNDGTTVGLPELNLQNPQTLCEKLQWLKLYYRKPEMTIMVDKYRVKEYVSKIVGEEHVIPTIGVWDKADDIDISTLPDKFVLKCTHSSGGMITCRDKNLFDFRAAKTFLSKILKRNHYFSAREWPYKDVQPRIIAEPLIEQLGTISSTEYKLTCMNGHVAFVSICTGVAHTDFDKRWNDHYDPDFNKLEWYVNYRPAPLAPEKPRKWNDLIAFCEKLCGDFPYVRVDTYMIDEKIIFGEYTFFTWGGFMKFNPKEWDLKLGRMLELPKTKTSL